MLDIKGRLYLKRYDRQLRVPASGRWAQIRHDTSPRHSIAYPATCQLRLAPYYIPLNEEFQKWYFSVLDLASGGILTEQELKSVWARLTDDHVAFTDRHSWANGFRDYILGLNPDSSDMAWATLTCTGNVVEILGGQDDYRIIRALNVNKLPSPYDFLNDPAICHWATEYNNGVVANFPHFEPFLGAGWGVPIPVLSLTDTQVIETEYLDRVGNGMPYQVYKR